MKKIIALIVIGMATVAIVGYNFYNKSHRKVTDEEAIQMDATSLFNAFENDEATANSMYLDKVIEVTGIVSDVELNQDGKQVIYIRTNNPLFGISCTMDSEDKEITTESVIVVKGFCKGFLSDVVLTDCVLTSK